MKSAALGPFRRERGVDAFFAGFRPGFSRISNGAAFSSWPARAYHFRRPSRPMKAAAAHWPVWATSIICSEMIRLTRWSAAPTRSPTSCMPWTANDFHLQQPN